MADIGISRDTIENELLKLSATPDYVGYRYLVRAIELVLGCEEMLYNITTKLYPTIAEEFSVSPINVERGIRTLIAIIWREGDIERLRQLTYKRNAPQPGNAKFIGMMSRRLLLRSKAQHERQRNQASL